MNAEITEALLPCPFCGETELRVAFSHEAGRWDIWEVECETCCVSKDGELGFTGDEARQSAIAAWNTRAAIEALSANTVAPDEPMADADDLAMQIESLFSEATNNACTCGSDPEGHCHYCAAWAAAHKKTAELLEAALATTAPDHCEWVETEQAPDAVAPDDTDYCGIVVLDDDAELGLIPRGEIIRTLRFFSSSALSEIPPHGLEEWAGASRQAIAHLERLASKPDGLTSAINAELLNRSKLRQELITYTINDWQALVRITDKITETDQPDRVRWEGVWYDGPLATAYLETLRAIGTMAKRNVAALLPQAKGTAE